MVKINILYIGILLFLLHPVGDGRWSALTPSRRRARIIPIQEGRSRVVEAVGVAWFRLNTVQAQHAANSLRALGLGQLAAYGYGAFQTGEWWTAILSIAFYGLAELFALRLLSDVEEAI